MPDRKNNLEENKNISCKDKKKRRSIALLFFFLSLFMIIAGILYPIIQETLKEQEKISSTLQK